MDYDGFSGNHFLLSVATKLRHLRTAILFLTALSELILMARAALIFGVDQAHHRGGFWWYSLEAVFHLTGAVIYA